MALSGTFLDLPLAYKGLVPFKLDPLLTYSWPGFFFTTSDPSIVVVYEVKNR